MGPRTLQILQRYWDCLQMVEKDGGHSAPPFHGYLGVTQGNPLSRTIFNLVVVAVIWH